MFHLKEAATSYKTDLPSVHSLCMVKLVNLGVKMGFLVSHWIKKNVTNIHKNDNTCGQISFTEKPADASYQEMDVNF